MKRPRGRALLWQSVYPLAWPVGLAYAMGVRLKNWAYNHRFLNTRHLSWPVVSIGNVSVGGTGKTPIVMLLANLLHECGWAVDVLSRGYGRTGENVIRVDPHGDAEVFGDEPLMMARRGISTYVGAERYRAGQLAEQSAIADIGPHVPLRAHILDDGFQHRRLARNVDIILLQPEDLQDRMLPVGRLREPLCALERADICVLRAEDADLKDRVLRLMRKTDPERVWVVERRTISPAELSSPRATSHTALAFCAIGDPHGFFDGLRKAGISVVEEIAFRDHHVYTQKDVDRLKDVARQSGAQCFVTTEKDNVRLAAQLRRELESEIPFFVAGLEVSLRDEAGAMTLLESLLGVPAGKPLQGEQRNVR